jgi:hypothetical protein
MQAATDPELPNKWPVSPHPHSPRNSEENLQNLGGRAAAWLYQNIMTSKSRWMLNLLWFVICLKYFITVCGKQVWELQTKYSSRFVPKLLFLLFKLNL